MSICRIIPYSYPYLALSASPGMEGATLVPVKDPPGGPQFQLWEITWDGDTRFTAFNVGLRRFLGYPGGDQQMLVLTSALLPGNQSWFSFGSKEAWGACALQCQVDIGQNVDSGATLPWIGAAIRTRGWRHGRQRELTWFLTAEA